MKNVMAYALYTKEDGIKDNTRVFVLSDFKGLHVFLQKRKYGVRKTNGIQGNNTSFLWKSEKKKYPNAKFESSQFIERTQVQDCPKKANEEKIQSKCKMNGSVFIEEYFKTGTLHISENNVFGVLKLAFELKLIEVYNACVLFLSQSIKTGNCVKIWRLSKKFNCYWLSEQVRIFMEEHMARSLKKRDEVSVVGSLINSHNDVHSLEFLLQFFSPHKYDNTMTNKGSISKLFFEIMKQDSMIWREHFKGYLEQLEEVKKNRGDTYISTKTRNDKMKKTFTSVMDKIVPTLEGLGAEELDNQRGAIPLRRKMATIAHDTNVILEQKENIKSGKNMRKGILVTGGIRNDNLEALSAVFMYEPHTDTWTTLPSLNHARFSHTMVALQGKVYVIGGKRKLKNAKTNNGKIKGEKIKTDHEERHCKYFHHTINTISNNQGFGNKRHIQNVFTMKNNCLVGISPNDSFTSYPSKQSCESHWLEPNQMSSVELFSIGSDKWSDVSSMILLRKEHSSVVVRDFIYVIGGHDGVTQLCSMEKYDPVKDEWTLENPMPRLCTGMSVVTDGRFLYIIGGYSRNEWLDTISCYDTVDKTWIKKNYPSMQVGRAFAGAELVVEDIFIFGGINQAGCLDECEIFNLISNKWRKGPSLNQARYSAGHCTTETNIFIFGGESSGEFLDTVEYLNIEEWKWRMAKKMPIRTAGLQCIQTTLKF